MMSLANAIIQQDISQIQTILDYGINLNELDEYGFTPLIEAAIEDNVEIARMLIEYGADVNLQDSIGSTPLHWAAENNNYNLTKLLLENDANPNTYNLAGQPPLVMPLLRQHNILKRLLIDAGANLDFAQDFINTKFIGHLFELVGTADIVDPYHQFVEVNFEGFFLEVTLAMITESFSQFRGHYAGRRIRHYDQLTNTIIESIQRAAQLIKYQQYRVDIKKNKTQIDSLMQQEPLIIPVGYEGHAITFIKFQNILVKCDRREESRLYDNIVIYQMNQPLNLDLIKDLIYEKQSNEFINVNFPQLLDLQPLTELKIAAQVSGNCSWANVEACIPALYFLLFSSSEDFQDNVSRYKKLSLDLFSQWREWSKDRALNFCIQSFQSSDSIRKTSKAELLAAILFQASHELTARNKERIEKILPVFTSQYHYILHNYIRVYCYEDKSEEGKNFLNLLKSYGILE